MAKGKVSSINNEVCEQIHILIQILSPRKFSQSIFISVSSGKFFLLRIYRPKKYLFLNFFSAILLILIKGDISRVYILMILLGYRQKIFDLFIFFILKPKVSNGPFIKN